MGAGRSQTYSSSGVIEVGTWYSATQNIYDSNGNLVATADVPVLQVTSIKCEQNARNCTPDDIPRALRTWASASPASPGATREEAGLQCLPQPDQRRRLQRHAAAGARRLAQRLCRDPDRHLSRPDLDQYRQWGAGKADAGRYQLAAWAAGNGSPRP